MRIGDKSDGEMEAVNNMDRESETDFTHWFAQLTAEQATPQQMAIAARRGAEQLAGTKALDHLKQAMQASTEDQITCDRCLALLPDFIQAEIEGRVSELQQPGFIELRDHLVLCPYCTAAYSQVTAWLLAGEADAIPTAATYPAFTFPFLSDELPAAAPQTSWPQALLAQAQAQGQQWLQDALGSLYLFFGPQLQATPATAWAIKSGASAERLAQITLGAAESNGWEVEAMVYSSTSGAETCRIEVALYPVDNPTADLAGIAVTLGYDMETQSVLTDAAGVVEFEAVPIAQLPLVALRIMLPR